MPTQEEKVAVKIEEVTNKMMTRMSEIFQDDELKGRMFTVRYQVPLQNILDEMQKMFGDEAVKQIIELYLDSSKEIQKFVNETYTN
jgi:hypothetical protein